MEMVSAPDIQRSHSLLPYLQGSRSEIRLKLSLFPAGTLRDKSYPFKVLDDTQPVSRTIEAVFLTDAGAVLKRVVLQIQKDRYFLPADELHPVTNPDIDACWRRALSESQEDGGGKILLAAQLDLQGVLIPLDPLFYCRTRELFFHPVCPDCGLTLTLCCDEALLKANGLASYANTCSRYLHCGACCDSGLSAFYLYELSHDDPVTAKDRWALIDRFREVDAGLDPNGAFPCVGCPEHAACYGAAPQVRARIFPFSFYPFYLLIDDLPTLHGNDFLRLVSRAQAGELADSLDPQRYPGRAAYLRELVLSGGAGEPLFAPGDERSFLETLFLKLSFLSDLLQRCSASGLAEMRLNCERIWVHLPLSSRTLPSFWNFHIAMAYDICPAGAGTRAVATPSEALCQLGIFWIQVLCQNEKIDQVDIHAAVAGWLRSGPGPLPGAPGDRWLAAILAPENIYWRSEGASVTGRWRSFWARAIEPVQLLLQAARWGGAVLTRAELVETLEALRRAVKAAIFAAAPLCARPVDLGGKPDLTATLGPEFGANPRSDARSDAGSDSGSDVRSDVRSSVDPQSGAPSGLESPAVPVLDNGSGQDVRAILQNLVERTRGQLEPDPPVAITDSQAPTGDDETVETVILAPGALRSRGEEVIPELGLSATFLPPHPPQSPGLEQVPMTEAAEDCLLETLLAAPSRLAGRYLQPTVEEPAARRQNRTAAPPPVAAGEMAETVCISPPGSRRPRD
jgi:hypothetical protein